MSEGTATVAAPVTAAVKAPRKRGVSNFRVYEVISKQEELPSAERLAAILAASGQILIEVPLAADNVKEGKGDNRGLAIARAKKFASSEAGKHLVGHSVVGIGLGDATVLGRKKSPGRKPGAGGAKPKVSAAQRLKELEAKNAELQAQINAQNAPKA